MKRYVLVLAYDGTKYAGWQRQPHAITVAGTVEKAIERLTGLSAKLSGAGRTDAGVHARQQFAQFDSSVPLPAPFLFRLNAVLPGDIRALTLYEAKADFHVRHSAIRRTYRYFIRWTPNPFERAYSLFLPKPPDLSILHEAAAALVGTRDFSAFTKDLRDQPHPICEVYEARWVVSTGEAYFEITANRFLRAMVRALVGAQLRLSQGKLKWEVFEAALHQADRRWGVYVAPPQGLFLWNVVYPPQSLYLLESYDLFQIEPSAASDAATESAPDTVRSSAGGASGGAG